MSFDFKGTMAPSHLHAACSDLSHPGTFRSIRGLLVQTAILGALWVPEFANAAEPEAYLESLASRFVAALRSKDISRRLAILHSRSRACISPETQPYFDWIFSRQLRLVVPAEYKVLVTSIGPTPSTIPTDGQSDFPIRPTHRIQIDFAANPSHSTSVIIFAAQEGSQWREVLPCPLADVQARARARQTEERGRQERSQSLVAEMPSALRTEITQLLRQGKKIDAIARYAAATGLDLGTAKDVIERLTASDATR